MASRHARRGFSANLAMLFKEHGDLIERCRRARAAGFEAVEFSTPELYGHRASELSAVLRDEGLRCVLFNMPAGDWAAGERGLAALPTRRTDFVKSISVTVEYAEALSCPRVHCLSGLAPLDRAEVGCYRENLAMAAEELRSAGVDVLIEPINQRSIPGYHLRSFAQAAETIVSLGDSAGVKLLFDVFHCQILHGDVSEHMRRYRDIIGHVQIAGVPERAEPDHKQEVNYPYVFQLLRGEIAYEGHIGCEYIPRSGTEAGLGWMDSTSFE